MRQRESAHREGRSRNKKNWSYAAFAEGINLHARVPQLHQTVSRSGSN